jgi:cell division protein ZapB
MRFGSIGEASGGGQHVLKVFESYVRHHDYRNNTAYRPAAVTMSTLCIAECSALYWRHMNENNPKAAVDLELKRLEKRLEELIVTLSQIKEENRALRQRQETLTSERAGLLQKNEQVRARVEAMIGRLKSMEQA